MAAILNLKVKTNPKYNEYQYIRSVKSELVENDASQVVIIHLAQEKSLLMFLNMVSETTTGAAILDLNIKMVSEYNKNLSIRSRMPNLVGKVSLFAF